MAEKSQTCEKRDGGDQIAVISEGTTFRRSHHEAARRWCVRLAYFNNAMTPIGVMPSMRFAAPWHAQAQ